VAQINKKEETKIYYHNKSILFKWIRSSWIGGKWCAKSKLCL